jgi:toxin ParE1/3/4
MSSTVIVLPEANDDLVELFLYISEHDSTGRAETLLLRLEEKCADLENNPQRGHVVPELKRVYIESYKEIHFKPYRIIYQIVSNKVYVHAVLDGRRELNDLLERRVLR